MKELHQDTKMIKGVLEEFASCHYSNLVKALLSYELSCDDEEILQEAYDDLMTKDGVNLISDELRDRVISLMEEKKGE